MQVKAVDLTDAAAAMFSPTAGVLTFHARADGTCFGQRVGPVSGIVDLCQGRRHLEVDFRHQFARAPRRWLKATLKTRFLSKPISMGIHLEATGKATSNRFAKAPRFLSTVHSKVVGVSRTDASSDISTAPHPKP